MNEPNPSGSSPRKLGVHLSMPIGEHEGEYTYNEDSGMETREYEPSHVTAKVGSLDLVYDPCDTSKYSATFDGEKIRSHRKIEIILEAKQPPIVRIEFYPLPKPKENA